MGKSLAKKIRGMSLRTKISIVFLLLVGSFLYQGVIKPLISDSATSTYYFKNTSVNVGADGTTSTSTQPGLNGRIAMSPVTYTSSSRVTANSTTNWQVMLNTYGPAYAASQTLTTPAVTIGTRDRNGTANLIYWKADVYDYNPAGTANNGILLWSSTGNDEAHAPAIAPEVLTFTNPGVKTIAANHRLKVIISCRMTSTNSQARLYWGAPTPGTDYSFMTVSEANAVANSVTVTNLADYNAGGLTSVIRGQSDIAMFKFDLFSNAASASWTGGKLDKIGSNSVLADATFSIYKDANGNGSFEPSDTLIGGPYNYSQATASGYTLATPQALTTTPQRYFITFNISGAATAATTIGARIVDNSYFTVTGAAGGVTNVTSTSSSIPKINGSGTPVTKIYPVDWDNSKTLLVPETSGPTATNSACIAGSITTPGDLVGLLNYPNHTCASVSGRFYTSNQANAKFATLYFNGSSGYSSIMTLVKATSLTYRISTTTSGGTFTATLFYVMPNGTRVNSPVTSTYSAAGQVSQIINMTLAGQTFANVPAGSRLGVQIGVNRSGCGIGLGSSVGAQLSVDETAAANSNVDVGDGSTILNANVLASSIDNLVDSFTLSATSNQVVTSVMITGNAMTTAGNVSSVKLYADNGTTIGVLDPSDTLLGSTSAFVGNSATISGFSEAVGGAPKRYLVAYDIAANPAATNIVVTGLVSALGGATIGNNTDASAAALTILPTTTLTNGAAEPGNKVIAPSGAATNVDAFGLKINGGANDTIRDVTVTLTTNTPPADGSLISSKVASVQIVDKNTLTVYGQLTAPTTGDDWQIATTGLMATLATTECYVRITPKTNVVATYNVSALITSLTHTKTNYGFVLADTSSSTVTIDGQAPSNPVLTATSGVAGGDIILGWTAATDTSGLHPTLSYKVVRGLGNAPAPTSCSSGTMVYQGTGTSFTNTGLSVGQMYGYRVCAIDVVNNTSSGTKASAPAGIPTVCTNAPSITVNPSSLYIKPGSQVTMTVGVSNNDTGACANSTFALSIVGAEDAVNFTTPSTLSLSNFILASNNAAKTVTLTITAKAGATQGASNMFHVAVSKNGGAAVQCPDMVTATVSNYGSMIHSSLQLGTRKFGAWGTNYNCATCHSPVGNNIKQIRDVIATPMGNRSVVFSATSSTAAVTSGVFGNDYRSGTVSSNVCEVCHHNTRFHQYSASKVAWKDHNNSADCMKCHSHAQGFKSVAIGAACNNCHGNPPTVNSELVYPASNALSQYASNAGAHAKHNSHNMACLTCHSNGNHVASPTPAGDSQINIGFSINNSNYPGFNGSVTTGAFTGNTLSGTYLWSAAPGTTVLPVPNTTTCNVYCHGWPGAGGYNNIPSWTGISQVGCGSCHDATGDTPPPGASHLHHASTLPSGNGIACTKCHGSRFVNYSSSVGHVNGKVEWDLSAVSASATYNGSNKGNTGALAPSASYKTCATLYCHSNVQTSGGIGGPTLYATPTWNGTTTCGSCHAEPNNTGGHSQHVSDAVTGFDCRICHGSGGDTNSLNHANGKIDFLFSGLGANTVYSYGPSKVPGINPYGQCSNSNCHGRRTITWGASTVIPLCDKCHGSATTVAFYGTAGPGTTTLKTDPQVGAHDQHIKSAPYNFATPSDCSACHQKPTGPYSPGHIDEPAPAVLIFGAVAKSGTQYANYTSLPTYNYVTRQCSNVWCHGAGMNSNTGNGLYASVVIDGGTLGTPTIPTWNVTLLNGTAANDCTRCHSYPPPAPLPGYTHYGFTVGPDCMGCHKHLNAAATGFTDSSLHIDGKIDSCNTCHGRPPVDAAGLANPPINALNPGFAGAHNAHFLNPNIGGVCNVCHNNYTPAMPSNKLEIGFNAFGGTVTTGIFYGYSTLTNNVYISSSVGTTVRRTNNAANVNVCTNLYCHGGGTTTLAVIGGGTNIAPDWELGSDEAICGSCHGVTSTTYVTRGSHARHAGIGAGQLALACANCHGIKTNNYHVNGKVEWQFYSTVLRVSPTASYTPATGTAGQSGNTGNLAPSAVYGTCTVYCHSNGKGTFKPLQWGGGALNCGSCHNDQYVTPTLSHAKHVATYGIACAICHYGAGSGTAKHVNGTLDIIFNTGVVGILAQYDSGTKNCYNIACHVSTVSTGPTWGNAVTGTTTYPATCVGCHSGTINNRIAVVPQFAGQSHHVQGVSLSNSHCYQCHMEALDINGNTDPAYHDKTAGKSVDLVVWGAGVRGAAFTRYTANGSVARKRTELSKLNTVCLSCHNLQNSTTTPINPFGDGKNPKSYAWDAKSVDERYSQAGTTKWGKYAATANAAKKNITKAFSAHGNAVNNARGWDTANGVDAVITNTSGSVNVLCFDCHNSHGTNATGIMSSYSSATGRNMGAILKSTTNGKGGYAADYTPTAGGSAAAPSKNAYNPGAALCFDCHNTAAASAVAPWGYNSTFGATQAIFGYRDAPYFGNNSFGTGTRYPFKNLSTAVRSSKMNHGGHFGASTPLTTAVSKPIKGLCTPCHDPHGVTTNAAFVSDQNYGVPLLKGTWMTSPYKEDVAPKNNNEARGGTNEASSDGISGGASDKPIRQLVGSTPMYNIDQITFGTTTVTGQSNYGPAQNASSWSFPNAANRIIQADAQFAGLCMQCHAKGALAPKAGLAVAPDTWKSASRIHGTVKGWATITAGSDGNASNAVHSYTCSKCHSTHNSNLPRLMVTNCLDFKHRGQVVSGGTVSATNGTSATGGGGTSIAGSGHQIVTGNKGDGRGRFPAGGNMRTNNGKQQNPGVWFFGLNPNPSSSGVFRNCHDTANTIDAAYPNKQFWNTKTPW